MSERAMFDEAFVADLKVKWAARPAWERPALYSVATAPERAAQRAWMAACLERVPEPGRSRLRSRLHSDQAFVTASTELAVAAALQDAGLLPHYEVEVDGVTPDFLVEGLDRPLLVEVWTRREPDQLRQDERAWSVLQGRVAEIPVPIGLHIIWPDREELRPPDSRSGKQIVRKLKEWLLAVWDAPQEGMTREIGGYVFRVGAVRIPGLRARLHTPEGGGWADSDTVLKAVRAKVLRYASATHSRAGYLLVVLSAEDGAGLQLNQLSSALAGKQTLSVSLDRLPGPGNLIAWKTPRWSSDEPETFDPALSAIGWLEVKVEEPGPLTLIPIQSAERSLSHLASPLVRWEGNGGSP